MLVGKTSCKKKLLAEFYLFGFGHWFWDAQVAKHYEQPIITGIGGWAFGKAFVRELVSDLISSLDRLKYRAHNI